MTAPERIFIIDGDFEFYPKTDDAGLPPGAVEYVRADSQGKAEVKVKPLEWQGPFPANGYKRGRWSAAEFTVTRKGKDCWRVYRSLIDQKDATYATPDEAKAAAQADYERRILSALTTEGQTCKKCGGELKPGQAMGQTFTAGEKDFASDDHATTFSAGGPGALIGCLKCTECGWSMTTTEGE